MRIGRCFNDFKSGAKEYGRLSDLGYEYLELPLTEVAEFDESQLGIIRQCAESAGLGIESCNIFFPGTLALLGDLFDENAVCGYVEGALGKAAALGIRTAVLGSGGARRRPEGMPAAQAEEKLADTFGKTADIAAEYGITIALEPLSAAECNTITSAMEGMAMVKRVNRENFRLLLDIYHMDQNHESLDVIPKAAPMLTHCHLAAIPDRGFPGPERMGSYIGFLTALRDAGYAGDISVEADTRTETADGGVWHLRKWVKGS